MLEMEAERQRLRLSMAVKEGVELALSKKPIPLRYFEAISASRDEAERRAFRVNVARKEASLGMR